MAQASAPKKVKSFEQILWESADKLRGTVASSEYKHIVLSLIFLKFVSDKFEEQRENLIAQGLGDYTGMVDFYTKDNVFYLPEESRWSTIQKQAKQEDIALRCTPLRRATRACVVRCRTTTSRARAWSRATSPRSSIRSATSTPSPTGKRTSSGGSMNTSSATSPPLKASAAVSSTPPSAWLTSSPR